MLIGRMLTETRQRAPGNIAFWFAERSWTYAELDDATNRIAAALSAAAVQSGEGDLPAPTFDEQQSAAILYTSGSTARPKGVTYSHLSLWHNCLIQSETFQFTPADVHLVSTAACHAAAFTGQLLPNIYVGSTA